MTLNVTDNQYGRQC